MEQNSTSLRRSDDRILTYIDFSTTCNKEFTEKNKEYGQTWLCYRPKSLLTRLWNKGTRIRSIQDKKEQLIDESVSDEFKAIYNYSIIAIIIVERLTNDKLAAVQHLNIDANDDILELYKKAQDKCHELFIKKDHDYNGAWVNMSISSIVDEIMVKLMRSNVILKNSNEISIDDLKRKLLEIFMDVANYAAFAGILIEKCNIDPLA